MATNFIDRFVGFLNPKLGAERARARVVEHLYNEQLRKLDAGSMGRRTLGWNTRTTGPNAETKDSIQTIRNRSRDLFYNNSDAHKAISVIVSNTVGTGIRPTYYLNPAETNKKSEATKKVINKAWKNFAEKTTFDFNGKLNFYGFQRQLGFTWAISGAGIIRVRRNETGFPFSFQMFEPEILDHTKENFQLQNGGIIHRGVEFDKEGREVAYWLYERNPFDQTGFVNMVSTRIPARDPKTGIYNVIRVFDQTRPGQIDGLPAGISSFLKLRDLDVYEDAELVKQQISACLSAFIYDNTADGVAGGLIRDSDSNVPLDRLEPGAIEVLPPGKDIKFSSPPSKEGFPEYVKTVKRNVAASYGVTYEALTGDLSNANFSSLKSGNNEFRKLVAGWQDSIFINDFCAKVWNIFLYGCELKGLIKITDRDDPSNDYPVSWTPPSLSMVDPTKEIPALIKSIRAGLTSWQDAQRQLGNDHEETISELTADNLAFDKNGLKLDSDPRADPQRMAMQTAKP